MTLTDHEQFVAHWLRPPLPSDNKYSRGVVTFVTGSQQYPGAALLGVQAALRTGVGMVRYSGPLEVARDVLHNYPEVVFEPGRQDALVVGSGIPVPLTTEDGARVRDALALKLPTVVDAGALEHVNECGSLCILTPHSEELRRTYRTLTGAEASDDREAARAIASATGSIVLVKGSITTIVNPEGIIRELPEATPWLASAGTGDVLAGILGALLAAQHKRLGEPNALSDIAVAGSLLHAWAGREASQARGGGPISATDVASQVSLVVGRLLG